MATTIQSSKLDFTTIKNNLKTYLANQEDFKDYNFEASALSNILDVLAHNTHMNALLANFALNESFLSTAQLRSSVVSLSENIGYIPDTKTSAQALTRIFFTTTTTPRDPTIALPAYTAFTSTIDDISYTFRTVEQFLATDDGTGFYEFKRSNGDNKIPIYEGSLRKKTFLVGDYIDNPVYVIPDSNLDADTVTVNVFTSSTGTQAVPYQNIIKATSINAQSTIYILKESPNGFYELSFGDGSTFGVAPAAGSRIEVQYLQSSGAAGNGGVTFSPVKSLSTGGVTATLQVTTFAKSLGGDEKETIDSIRKKAPFQYATQNRMVTAEDYSSLILRNYSTLIKDIVSFGGQDALLPEFGAVVTSILFEDDVDATRQEETKRAIIELARQLSVVSFNLRFADPETTFIELDTFFQFNPNLTSETINSAKTSVETIISNYFAANTGKFKQAFRRSNLLSLIDDHSGAVLSSRANVRMQRRFTPSTPNLVAVINNLTLSSLTDAQINYVVELVTRKKFKKAATFLTSNNYSTSNYTVTLNTLSKASITNNQTLRYAAPIAIPDDDQYIITSSNFTFNGVEGFIRNTLLSTNLEIVNASGTDILLDSVGSYNPALGEATVNYFNPTALSGGLTQVKLSAVPANQSAIAPIRNELLVFDSQRSQTLGVIVSAEN